MDLKKHQGEESIKQQRQQENFMEVKMMMIKERKVNTHTQTRK